MSDKLKPEELDLIQRVQRARMAHDAEALPSQITGVYWLECKPQQATQAPTPRAGYWRIVTTVQAVDALWLEIKQATEAGQLGYKSKVASVSRTGNRDERVIHVLTYDAADAADVARVREALRDLGITEPIEYFRNDE